MKLILCFHGDRFEHWKSIKCFQLSRKDSRESDSLFEIINIPQSESLWGRVACTHSSVLAWRIPGMGEPGGLVSTGVAQGRTQLKWLSSSSSLYSCHPRLCSLCLNAYVMTLEKSPQILLLKTATVGLLRMLRGNKSACQCRRHRFNPWVWKIPRRRKWQPTPIFCLENPMDRGACWVTVHRVAKSWTHLGRLNLQQGFLRTFCKNCSAAAAAKSLQSCPTLCDPIDASPPGSPVPGILQARTLEWVKMSWRENKFLLRR